MKVSAFVKIPPSAVVGWFELNSLDGAPETIVAGISDAISTYIRAKDGNRPWLMRQAFTDEACLEMVVKTEAIAFPSTATGVEAITETLVRQFSCDNEKIYTFCLSSPPDGYQRQFSCDWLVGMSRRDNGEIRVGCGRYDWSFSNPEEMLVDNLKITIEVMQILSPEHLGPVMDWLSALPYPWCSSRAAVQGAPGLDDLRPISALLRRSALG